MTNTLQVRLKLADEIIDLAGQADAISKSQAIASFSLDGTVLSANQNFLNLFGYTMAEIEGRHHSIFVEPAYAQTAAYRQFWSILHNGQFQAAEFKRIGKDGREIWLQASYNPILGFDGRPSKVMKFATDVTQRKRNEVLLAAQVKAIAKSQAVIEFDLDGMVLAANENYLAILGYELDEVIGRHHRMFVDAEHRDTAEYQNFWAGLRGGVYHAAEFKRIGKAGQHVWLQATYNPILDLNNAPFKVVKFATDITARKRAETQIVALEAKFLALRDTPDNTKLLLFESIVVHAQDAILITEAEPRSLPGPRIVYANPAFTEMTGYTLEDVTGQTPRMFQGPLTGAQAPARIKAALIAWQPIQLEIFNYHKNGEGYWVELNISPLCDEHGRYTHWISVQRDITARKQAEETARLSAERLALATESGGIGIWEWDIVSGEVIWDSRMRRLYDLDPVGGPITVDLWKDRLHKADRDAAERDVMDAVAGASRFDTSFRVIWRDGGVHHIRGVAEVTRDAGGAPLRMLGVNWDVTREVEENLALSAATERMRLAADGGEIGILEYDVAAKLVALDEWVYRIYGTPQGDSWVSPEIWDQRIHPEDRARRLRARDDALAGIRPYNIEYRIIRDDGAVRYLSAAAKVARDAAGNPLRMIGTIQDVTERKEISTALVAHAAALQHMNERLKVTADRLNLATESGCIGIWDWDIVHDLMLWDDWMCRLYDVQPEQAAIADTYQLWSRRLHPDDRAAAEQAVADAIAGTRAFDASFRVLWRDGSVHHIRATGEVTRDAAGAALRMVGVNWDVTAQLAQNHALREVTARMMLAADGGGIGILELDLVHDVMRADEWACRIFGIPYVPDAGVPGDTWKLQIHPQDRARRDQARQDAIDGIAPYAIEYRIIRGDGIMRHLKCSGAITRDAAGKALRMTGSVQDITARMEIEGSLLESTDELKRSNEELSQFAVIASHDLQEPLRMVASYLQLLAKRYKGKLDDDADEFIGFAVDGAKRMQRLIQDLLAYSRIGSKGAELRQTGAGAALAAALSNLQGAIEQSGAVVTHDALPSVLADESQLRQLFQNLVGNAIKYCGPQAPLIHISATKAEAGRWRFAVQDNGLGIDAQHFTRIFGMFQRLHAVDEYSGTGIGLAICKKITDRHGGVIGVDSKPGQGSCFHFTLAGMAAEVIEGTKQPSRRPPEDAGAW